MDRDEHVPFGGDNTRPHGSSVIENDHAARVLFTGTTLVPGRSLPALPTDRIVNGWNSDGQIIPGPWHPLLPLGAGLQNPLFIGSPLVREPLSRGGVPGKCHPGVESGDAGAKVRVKFGDEAVESQLPSADSLRRGRMVESSRGTMAGPPSSHKSEHPARAHDKTKQPTDAMRLYAHTRVASLAGRGMRIPVKHHHKKKPTVCSSGPPKRPGEQVVEKTSKEKIEAMRPTAEHSKHIFNLKRKRSDLHKDPDLSVDAATTARPQRKEALISLESVVTGAALPAHPAQAKAAADVRYHRLLAHHQNQQPQQPSKKAVSKHADLMPEFFDTSDFTDGGEDEVRCVCGATKDDGTPMVSCDKCLIWQHSACVVAVPPDDVGEGSYLCHVCDPWAHREVIAMLRREGIYGA